MNAIMQKICSRYSQEGAEMIMAAYNMAVDSLAGMERSNHEPFINHPVKVAE
ncbi:MAG: hypothetical protein HUJ90_08155, partial [Bacteroidales bacterium]|nr:hypothetical protein [Bacteroidales bacterium]